MGANDSVSACPLAIDGVFGTQDIRSILTRHP